LAALHIDHGSRKRVMQLGQPHRTLGSVTLFDCGTRLKPHRDEPEQKETERYRRV
jgi:hypothetical protein